MSDNTVLICGSRSIKNYSYVPQAVSGAPFEVDEIIHGGASGVDSNVTPYAKLNGIPYTVVEPDYEEHGEYAPLARNIEMIDESDAVIAIWDGESSGTRYTIREAENRGMANIGQVQYESGVMFVYIARAGVIP